jgi:DNA polymerase III epsilon subunit-like protein
MGQGRQKYVVFDLETTGLDPFNDMIAEVAFVVISEGGNVIEEFDSLVRVPHFDRAGNHVDLGTQFHGIRWEEVDQAPHLRDLAPRILDLVNGSVLIGHNARQFDVPFLISALARCGQVMFLDRVIDTWEQDRMMFPDRKHRLSDACAEWGIPLIGAHRALPDTRATAALAIRQSISIGWGGGE